MAQHVIPASQLVPKYHSIRRCNNYVMLQSIPCSPECKIAGQLLLDHLLSYSLTRTVDVHAVYLQQFWRTVNKVPVETFDNPFVAPVNIKTIEAFMNRDGYQGVIDKVSAIYMKNLAQPWKTIFKDFMNNVKQKREAIQYPRFKKLIIVDLMKKFLEIIQRIEEDYHSIKDDIRLVSVYTTGDVRVRGMLISDEFLTEKIRAPNDFKEDHDDDDSKDRLEPESQKDNPEHVDDDDKRDDEKVDEEEGGGIGSLETKIKET
nr:hypothetical protein [Tanacetum cinerariifolium]